MTVMHACIIMYRVLCKSLSFSSNFLIKLSLFKVPCFVRRLSYIGPFHLISALAPPLVGGGGEGRVQIFNRMAHFLVPNQNLKSENGSTFSTEIVQISAYAELNDRCA